MIPATVRAGLRRLMPRPPSGPLPLSLPRRRIYIVPSRFGLVYGAALFFLLLGALNYNNNAAILLALLLGMVAMASAVAAVLFLSRLSVDAAECGDVFAGGDQSCRLDLRTARSRIAGDVQLRHGKTVAAARVASPTVLRFEWIWPAVRRGRRELGRVRLSTTYPLGLFYAWCIVEPAVASLVFPAPERPPAPLPTPRAAAGEQARPQTGDSEWHGLREFQRGDSPRDIAWKTSARHDRWLVNEMAGTREAPTLRLSLDQVSTMQREAGIARLAGWVLACEEQQRSYQLALDGTMLGPGCGPLQQRQALAALAELP